ncbi:MAG: hypothetical protein FWC59_02305 [Actinomycetia bacterium]|nr:hypothetical protein [Actinomycetes bacterium]
MATQKKVTQVEARTDPNAPQPTWQPTAEAKGKATRNRIIAFVLWALAIGAEAFAIFWLLPHYSSVSLFMVWLIVLIVGIAGLAIGGNLLWKKANKYDPASRANKVQFFIQNQLGAIITAIAFLPLIILIFLNKNMSGKEKGIAGAVAIVLCLVGVWTGISLNPPSVEEYAAQTQQVEALTGQDHVYWTAHGTKYHLYDDCPYINTDKTQEIFSGTVGTAFAEIKGLDRETPLCSYCRNRWIREHPGSSDGTSDTGGDTTTPSDGTSGGQ